MQDSYHRDIQYLRLSVTDRCNFRCRYCIPASGVSWLKPEQLLNFNELERICGIFASLGIRHIRLTGGEPLLRSRLNELVYRLKSLDGIETVSITTNGFLLKNQLKSLMLAGLNSVNISLDTLNSKRFVSITGQDALSQVLSSLYSACEADFPVKTNTVTMRGFNEEDWEALAELARSQVRAVRFIELMPIGRAKEFFPVSGTDVQQRLEQIFGFMSPFEQKLGNGPASYYSLPGFKGKIGFIDAIHHVFCQSCNRVRITADGQLKSCLYHPGTVNLRKMLRGGASNEEFLQTILQQVKNKPLSHLFSKNDSNNGADIRCMNEIGG